MAALPSGLTRPRLQGWAPVLPGDPPSLLELGSTYLPYERELRERWTSWLHSYRQTPLGQRVPSDLVAVLREAPAPPGLFRAVGRRATFRAYPLPARPVEGPWIVLEDPEERPHEGRCYRIPRPRRRVVVWKDEKRGLLSEDVLWAESPERVAESEFFPPPTLSAREAEEAVRGFSDATGLDPGLAPLLLLPFVGAPPFHGRPPGLDVVMGSWGVPTGVLSPAVAPLRALLPPWQVRLARGKGRGARGSRGSRGSLGPSYSAPYSVVIDTLGSRAWDRVQSKGSGFESSHLLYGGADGDDLYRVLFDPHVPLMEPADRWQELAMTRVPEEAAGEWADHLVRAHFHEPQLPETEELHRCLDLALGKVREALTDLPTQLGLPRSDFDGVLLHARGLRDHLVQAGTGRAKLVGRAAVLPEDLLAIADRLVAAVSDPALGSSRATRELLSRGGRLRSKRSQARYFVLRAVLMERGDMSLADLWSRLRSKGLWSDREELEEHLLQLSEQGVLFSLRPGSFRWEGI